MSWQSYVDDQMVATKHVKQGCITGLDGTIWAITPGFAVCKFFDGRCLIELRIEVS